MTGLSDMGPMSSIKLPPTPFSERDRELLLALAKGSIRHGLQHGRSVPVDAATYTAPLQQQRASFVTLMKQGQLRGCVGHLEAAQPVVSDVAANAYSAAFEDPRFPSVTAAELPLLDIHISLLTPAQLLVVDSEADLIDLLHPGKDGLILEEGHHRGTFLPSVWAQLPDPKAFITQLKIKAGLPAGHWSKNIRVYRYTTESFP